MLDEAAEVEISIYKVTSNQVRRLRLGRQNAGEYHTREKAAYWDGRNDAGETMGSGIYLYEMRTGDYTSVRKAMLLK
ncbi:MAG: FlgD immunoglobulin-like domain containing protein [Candidatus Poribacteria bacterium]